MSTTLLHLPDDIIDLILQFCPFNQAAVLLWRTGNRLLQQRLAKGCTEVSLKALSEFNFLAPRVLLELRNLRHLTLIGDQLVRQTQNSDDWNSFLSLLPKTLETLDLNAVGVFIALQVYPDGAACMKELFDLPNAFPHLRKLGITSYMASNSSLFGRLPPTLTTLKCRMVFDYGTPSRARAILPPSLTRIEGRVSIAGSKDQFGSKLELLVEDWRESLPLLTSIGLIDVADTATDHYEWLPRSLTSCQILPTPRWSPKVASSMPAGLKHIKYRRANDPHGLGSMNWISSLPHHLTELRFDDAAPNWKIGPTDVASLPRSLTLMQTRGRVFDWEAFQTVWKVPPECDAILAAWPPALSTLITDHVLATALYILPQSLRRLEICISWSGETDERLVDASLLPSHLTSLSMKPAAGRSVDFQHRFPATLETLFLDSMVLCRSNLDSFPPSLTDLRFVRSVLRDCGKRETVWRFPEGIKTLHLRNWPIDALDLIPRSVTELSFTMNDYGEYIHWKDGNAFSGLPPALESLELNGDVRPPWPIPSQHIPASIKRCLFLKMCRFPSAMLRCLAPQLQELTLNLLQLDLADAPFIPPHLKIAKIQCKLPDGIEKYWPIACCLDLTQSRSSKFIELRRSELLD